MQYEQAWVRFHLHSLPVLPKTKLRSSFSQTFSSSTTTVLTSFYLDVDKSFSFSSRHQYSRNGFFFFFSFFPSWSLDNDRQGVCWAIQHTFSKWRYRYESRWLHSWRAAHRLCCMYNVSQRDQDCLGQSIQRATTCCRDVQHYQWTKHPKIAFSSSHAESVRWSEGM